MPKKKVLVVGGANIEYILKSKEPIKIGAKNFVDIEELFGGSGMNYASRLLAIGCDVIALLFVGDDSIGHKIDAKLKSYKPDLELTFVPQLTTPRSIIVVDGKERTILSQDQNSKNIFRPFVEKELKKFDDISSLVIGHIHNDREDINSDISDLSTSYLIDRYKNSTTLIYLNFGASQLDYGYEYWLERLCGVSLFQLNIKELSNFIDKDSELNLSDLIKKVREFKTSLIITLDKFGAIGIHKDHPDEIYLARAISDEENFVDSTGAGDAFCAGMVYALNGDKNFSKDDLKEAMKVGRSWATYACNFYGGANRCPNQEEISLYAKNFLTDSKVATYKGEEMEDILSLLDSMLKDQ